MKRANQFVSHSVKVIDQPSYSVFCEHGPCLLFERTKRNETEPERFFACSVYRNRKYCNFYLAENMLKKNKKPRLLGDDSSSSAVKNLYSKLTLIRKLPSEKRCFCSTCQQLIHQKETSQHNGHKLEWGITNFQLRNPTKLLNASIDKDKESQYWFSKAALTFLAESAVRLDFNAILCVGCPRLFETLNGSAYKTKIKSFLLDYDSRFAQFWSPRFFAQYNMVANYFYSKLGEKRLEKFFDELQMQSENSNSGGSKLLIIVDPPFGALCCQIAKSVQFLRSKFLNKKQPDEENDENSVSTIPPNEDKSCQCVWVAPYFLEPKIKENWSEMTMLDYQVEYDNHPLYKKSNGKSAVGSPIRIFTTLSASLMTLPENQYRFCKKCKRYVFKTNKHCDLCKTCPSKDGKTYVHCKSCAKCVKPTYSHCEKCSRCHLTGSNCIDKELVVDQGPPKRINNKRK